MIRLFNRNAEQEHRSYLASFAARSLRRALVQDARRKQAVPRESLGHPISLDEGAPPPERAPPLDILALDAALSKLTMVAPKAARIVELRYFGGLSAEETAEALSMSVAEIESAWRAGRAWLRGELAS
ncbi:MAG: ECF-type sigma factor [Acidobacteriota bacterium]